MIFGPKDDGTYPVEFRTAEALAISIPRSEAHVIRHFQERMPYGLFVPDVPSEQAKPDAVTSPLPPAADMQSRWLGAAMCHRRSCSLPSIAWLM